MQFFQKRFENGNLPPSTLPNPNYKAAYEVVDEDTLDLAETYLKEGLRPAALNLANAYQPGGGVEQGCSAQEESIFRRTNYHQAIRQRPSIPLMCKYFAQRKGTLLKKTKRRVISIGNPLPLI